MDESRIPRTGKPRCPMCGSDALCVGTTGVYKHTFVPHGRWMFMGYRAHAFVCLDCGFLGHCLAKADLQQLRAEHQRSRL